MKTSLHLQGSPPDGQAYVPIPTRDLTSTNGSSAGTAPPFMSGAAVTAVSIASIHRLDIRTLVLCFRGLSVTDWGSGVSRVCKRWSLVMTSVDSQLCWSWALECSDPLVWVKRSLLTRVQQMMARTQHHHNRNPRQNAVSAPTPFPTLDTAAPRTHHATSSVLSTPHRLGSANSSLPISLPSIVNQSTSGEVAHTPGTGTGMVGIRQHSPSVATANGSPTLARYSGAASFLDPSPLPVLVPIAVAAAAAAHPHSPFDDDGEEGEDGEAGAGAGAGGDAEDDISDAVYHRVAANAAPAPGTLAAAIAFDPTDELNRPLAGAGGDQHANALTIDVPTIIEQFRRAIPHQTKRRAQLLNSQKSTASASAKQQPQSPSGTIDASVVVSSSSPAGMLPLSAPCPQRTAYLRVRTQIETALNTAIEVAHSHHNELRKRVRNRAFESDWWAFTAQINRVRKYSMWIGIALLMALVLALGLTHDGYWSITESLGARTNGYEEWIVVGTPLIGCALLLNLTLWYGFRIHVRYNLYDYLAPPVTTGTGTGIGTAQQPAAAVGGGSKPRSNRSCCPNIRWYLLWWFRLSLPSIGVGLLISSVLVTIKLQYDANQHRDSEPKPLPFESSLTYLYSLLPAAIPFAALTLVLIGSHFSHTLYSLLPILWFFGSPLRAMRDRRRTAITFLFLLITTAFISIALKLDHRLLLGGSTDSNLNTNESGWSIAFIPIWGAIIPVSRLLFIYRRSELEKRSDQWMYSVPLFSCLLIPFYVFWVLLTLQLDTIISFRFLYLLAPLLLPVVAVPLCQWLLYCTLVRHHYDD